MSDGIDAGELDRRITIMRGGSKDDGLATVPDTQIPEMQRWAKKTEVSDAERVRTAQQGIEVTSRFLVRSDALTRTLTSQDVVVCDDVDYAVVGIKEARGRRVGIEITAVARPYAPDAPQ